MKYTRTLLDLATQSVILDLAPAASPRSFPEMQNLEPSPECLKQKLLLSNISRACIYPEKFEKALRHLYILGNIWDNRKMHSRAW